MPEPREHTINRNLVESVLRYIPGFRGYLEKEYRRASDDLQRVWLADRLQRSKRAIDELTRPLVDAGQIDLLPQVDRLRGRLDKLIGRIRGGRDPGQPARRDPRPAGGQPSPLGRGLAGRPGGAEATRW